MENDVITYVDKLGIRYLEYKKLNELGVKNCFTLKPLNYSFNHQDASITLDNFKTICDIKNFNYEKLCRPRQNHTNKNQIVEDIYGVNHMYFFGTDGLITNQKDVPLAITTADCIPVIIYDEEKKVIACIHSGWKGSLNEITGNAIDMMLKHYNSSLEHLLIFFGPSICQNCFEVENDVYSLFKDKFNYLPNMDDIIKTGKIVNGKQKYYIDTILLTETLLINKGIKKANIYKANICTFENSHLMHSYRARKEKVFGLNVTIVSL